MSLRSKRELAARILKCGVNRVWIDPSRLDEVEEALTKADIRKLINSGVIKARQKVGVSKVRARYIAKQKKSGRRSGHGKRKGGKFARAPRKTQWIKKIRALRLELKAHKKELPPKIYRNFYVLASSGMFRDRAHLKLIIERVKKETKK